MTELPVTDERAHLRERVLPAARGSTASARASRPPRSPPAGGAGPRPVRRPAGRAAAAGVAPVPGRGARAARRGRAALRRPGLPRGVEELTARPADELAVLDVEAHRARVGELLGRVSDAVRGPVGPDRRGADRMGRDLRRARLRGAGLRGAYLDGADLRGVDLGTADLLGADVRAADVRGADLSSCLFLAQPRVSAAMGNAATRIPAAVRRPAHRQPTGD